MANHSPRSVVVTGASGGLGAALAYAYAAPGVVLGLTGRDAGRLEQCARQCRDAGATVFTEALDLRDGDAVAQWLCRFDDAHPIDLAIANAGVASILSSVDDWEDIRRTTAVFDTNFFGALHTVLPIIERMRHRKRGQIAMVSSLAAIRGMAISPAYCASKSALRAYGESVRPLLARDSVFLSIVLPGFVKTAMSDVFPGGKPFMLTPAKAAWVIQRGLATRRKVIAFPGLLSIGMGLLRALPAWLGDVILNVTYPLREERSKR
jgi:short-subunit dehydrogenase